MDYTDINSKTIDKWIDEENWEWGKPITHETFLEAKNGKWNMLLTPTKYVPKEWFPDLKDKKVLLKHIGFNILLFALFCMQDLLIETEKYADSVACISVDLQVSPMASFWVLIWLFPKLLMYSVCFYQFIRIYESQSCYFIIRNSQKNDLYIIITKKVLQMMLSYFLVRIVELSVLGIFPQALEDISYILMEMMWILFLYLCSVCIWSIIKTQWICMVVISVVITMCFVILLNFYENIFTQMLFIRSNNSFFIFIALTILLFILSMKMTLKFYYREGGV